jgi:hypothetical protein
MASALLLASCLLVQQESTSVLEAEAVDFLWNISVLSTVVTQMVVVAVVVVMVVGWLA